MNFNLDLMLPWLIGLGVALVLFFVLLALQMKGKKPKSAGMIEVRLFSPNKPGFEPMRVPLPIDGKLSLKDGKVEVQLVPELAVPNLKTGEREVWIDVERSLQIAYTGLGGFVGPDGAFMLASTVKEDGKALNTRGIDWSKYAWPVAIGIVGAFGSMAAVALFAVS